MYIYFYFFLLILFRNSQLAMYFRKWSIIIKKKRLKYLFGPHFRSVCCGWSSFWQNI